MLERWALHGRLSGEAGESTTFAVMFLRGVDAADGGPPVPWHALLWTRSGLGGREPAVRTWMDGRAVAMLRSAVEADEAMDSRVRTALAEALADGTPVPPDRLLPGPVAVAGKGPVALEYGGVATLRETADGAYRFTVLEEDGRGLDLVVAPTRAALPYSGLGDLGGHCRPRCGMRGVITGPGERPVVVSGSGWYDHTTGADLPRMSGGRRTADAGWSLLDIGLDCGWDIRVGDVQVQDVVSRRITERRTAADAMAPDGTVVHDRPDLAASSSWTSLATLNTYPTSWEVRLPEVDAQLTVTATVDRDIRSLLFGLGLLSTDAEVRGTLGGRPVRGRARVEVVPAQQVTDIEEYLGRLQAVTRREVNRLFPDRPSPALTASLLGGCGTPTDGMPDTTVHETLVRPIRHLTDPGGRGWRTFVCCAAMELLGVSGDQYTPLLAVVEVIHSANLAIDDVQDESTSRRGVPAVHTVYGVPTAINAATAAYFVLDRVIEDLVPDDDALRLGVHQRWIRTLRAAHGGQAIDIAGHTEAMDQAVAAHDPTALLVRIQAAHRFKTGLPARAFAEIGALIARGDTMRIAALGEYFEAVGTAYQITDDLLDLYGATIPAPQGARRKHCGEDLRAGKVTMPLARAVSLLPADEISRLWRSVRGGGADQATVREVAAAVTGCGAVQACYQEAKAHVDAAWRRLEPLLAESLTKVLVRALGNYAALREPEVSARGGASWK
ncbi:polyprenyl synthetase family protein [Streptomyces sp. NPDC048595]|uniref:polyprenyl synthetase family protein n=1 Tax=Streptomyces sp. NPDC048595 TaxID=3365576 RepID=UPI0037180554